MDHRCVGIGFFIIIIL